MSSGISGNYNGETQFNTIYSNNVISPVAGVNPADNGYVTIANVRGQLSIAITSGDNSYTSIFNITGGFGEWPNQYTLNWYPLIFSCIGCTVTNPSLNIIQIQTPVADAGGRTYLMQFFSTLTMGPQIRQTSVNLIGNNTLTVRLTKTIISTVGF